MTTITFDTLEFVNKLRKAGATEEYAQAEAEAVRDAISSTLGANFSTHNDTIQIDRRVDSLESKIDALDTSFAGKLSDLRFDLLKWIVGLAFAQFALLIGILLKISL